MEKQQIYDKIREALIEDFELDPEKVVPEARLYEDLNLDSIDAVDLIVKLKTFIPRNIDPEVFKSMRTLQDVVDGINDLAQGTEEKK
ncbi:MULTISPECIES: acyl carrier protein [Hallerella]|uniref:Acyl carrier protein n=1 Tax=Hallerella succinigenes TaxID=1896222 RepID=A0A2M9A5T0_9BACT|nr:MULTISPECIES: acyl carrier protein [Hallerella]MBS7392105.1 acyl carrier protein [Fibrobacter sp.]MCI6872924.1 acyl carrier protein [Hallerella sp.]MDD6092687.1 acyl carrier protein [Hallerella succinigenes]MDY5030219.1 acyl carrier protein [Hallerella succinigenes]PJJ41070.1 acyl carrier protein [Hallerella succinigenes]